MDADPAHTDTVEHALCGSVERGGFGKHILLLCPCPDAAPLPIGGTVVPTGNQQRPDLAKQPLIGIVTAGLDRHRPTVDSLGGIKLCHSDLSKCPKA